MHDDGIPARADWPPGVLAAVAEFHQGDAIANLPLFYWGDPSNPTHARTSEYAAHGEVDPQVIAFPEPAPYGLVTTQTCELAQEGDGPLRSAWVSLAPIFDGTSSRPKDPDKRLLDGGERKRVQQGKDQLRLYIPNIPAEGFWFADLSFEVMVERSWLGAQPRIEAFTNETGREEVGKRLAWLRARPAFDSKFVEAVQQPTTQALRDLAKNDKPARDRMDDQVLELGVVVNGRLSIAQAELVVLHDGIDPDLVLWWEQHWVTLKGNADAAGFNLLPLRIEDVTTLPTSEYLKLTRLPLAAISPNPAWYGEDPDGFPE